VARLRLPIVAGLTQLGHHISERLQLGFHHCEFRGSFSRVQSKAAVGRSLSPGLRFCQGAPLFGQQSLYLTLERRDFIVYMTLERRDFIV
jgi:hypothetical protein